ncbi:MAG: tetratricopeptide repeat protein [Anaerolineae bacterium]|nr:tetratricopeptide repeat protein [Anaerolineae bacterium]
MNTPTTDQLKAQGLALFQEGKKNEALIVFETAVAAYTQEGNEDGRAEMLNNIGVIQRVKGNNQAAIAALSEAGEIFSQLGNTDKQAQTLANLADLYAFNKQQDQAARCYSEAAALFAQLNQRDKQSQVLRTYSLMRLKQGQWLEAMLRMEESLSIKPRPGPLRWFYRALLRFALGLMGAG